MRKTFFVLLTALLALACASVAIANTGPPPDAASMMYQQQDRGLGLNVKIDVGQFLAIDARFGASASDNQAIAALDDAATLAKTSSSVELDNYLYSTFPRAPIDIGARHAEPILEPEVTDLRRI